MKRTDTRAIGAAVALALGGLAACQDDLPTAVDAPSPTVLRPSLRVAAVVERPTWRPPQNGVGTFLLPKACDVWIGETEFDPNDPEAAADEPLKYPFQLVVVVPTQATIKLVAPNSAEFARWEQAAIEATATAAPADRYVPYDVVAGGPDGLVGYDEYDEANHQFVCDPTDPVDPTYRVVDPVTDHAAKGDGPKLVTEGVTLNLAGNGIRAGLKPDLLPMIGTVDDDADGQPDLDPVTGLPLPGEPYDNMGIVLMGSYNKVTNSVTTHVARFSGFGHALELEGDNLSIIGRVNSGDVLAGTAVLNIETAGGLGARLSTGDNVIRYVKSVDLTTTEPDADNPGGPDVAVGVGFEVRRCQPGSTIRIQDSHFEGNGEAAIIRECGTGSPNEDWGGDVTFQNNYVSSPTGVGLNTRETTGGLGSNIIIRNNVFDMKGTGTHAIEWTRETTGLTITGNTIGGLGAGACAVFNEGRDTGGFPSVASLLDNNTFTNADGTPVTADQLLACGIPLNGGTPGTPPPPPPPPPLNVAPTASIATSCIARACTMSMTASDADGTIASYVIVFGDGTTQNGTGAPPATLAHTYPVAQSGLVAPTLTVTDDGGNPGPLSFTATSNSVMIAASAVDQITAAFTASCEGTRCRFDASASHADLAGAGAAITGYQWVYRLGTGAETVFATTRTAVLNFNTAGLPLQMHQVRVRVTDNRGAGYSKWAARQNVTPIVLTVTKNNATRRTTLTWSGPTTQVAIFEGTAPTALNPTPVALRAATGSYLAPAIQRGVARYYKVCLTNSPSMCSVVSGQVMYF